MLLCPVTFQMILKSSKLFEVLAYAQKVLILEGLLFIYLLLLLFYLDRSHINLTQ